MKAKEQKKSNKPDWATLQPKHNIEHSKCTAQVRSLIEFSNHLTGAENVYRVFTEKKKKKGIESRGN